MLFGSDYPLITPDRWLADFEKLEFNAEVRPKILKDNAARLPAWARRDRDRSRPVEPERLGRTLPHEHLFILGHETLQNFNRSWGKAWWDEEVRVADAVAQLQRVRDAGIERSSTRPPSASAGTSVASSGSTRRST